MKRLAEEAGPFVRRLFVLIAAFSALLPADWKDPSPHDTSFISVDNDVRLEVLDWGGSGRALVLLAGLGNTAHVYDDFAPKLTGTYHVFGITRRGYGASTAAALGYDANRLGDDVLAVLDALHLNRPVLVGHSIAGEELSSVGSRHPERVAGLIYLDAAYQYAFENGKGTTMAELRELNKILPPPIPRPGSPATYSAAVDWFAQERGFRFPEAEIRQTILPDSDGKPGENRTPGSVGKMVQEGAAKFARIDVPVLALSAMPQRIPHYLLNMPGPEVRAAAETFDARFNALKEKQLKAFEEGIPLSRVVRIANADHYAYITNEAEVLREMRAFLLTLKP